MFADEYELAHSWASSAYINGSRYISTYVPAPELLRGVAYSSRVLLGGTDVPFRPLMRG